VEAGEIAKLGHVWVERDQGGALRALHLAGLDPGSAGVPSGSSALGRDVRVALEGYVGGREGALWDLPLIAARTEFAARLRAAMRSIPRGEVRTYAQLARDLGRPGASRAVGRGCGANPLPVIVPCHRVVAARGWGGFSLGLEAKRALLALEGIDVARSARFR